jgi:hypothetical protein
LILDKLTDYYRKIRKIHYFDENYHERILNYRDCIMGCKYENNEIYKSDYPWEYSRNGIPTMEFTKENTKYLSFHNNHVLDDDIVNYGEVFSSTRFEHDNPLLYNEE